MLADTSVSDLLSGAGTVLGIIIAAAALYAAFVVTRNKGRMDALAAQLDLYIDANGELREQIAFERNERERQEGHCATQITELRATINTLQGETVTKLVEAIAGAVTDGQSQMISELIAAIRTDVVDAVHSAVNRPDRRSE